MADHVLEVRDLRVSFHSATGVTEAVRGVSFDLPRGKTIALVGESGSGKSVTSYSLMRLIQPPGRITDGSITLRSGDEEPIDLAALVEHDERLYRIRGGRIAMIFQEPMTALSPVHRIGGQLSEALRLHEKISRKAAWARCTQMLEKVGMPDAAGRMKAYPFELSGGMRQRVVIAMALVTRPEIIIADEPTTALDVTVQAQILDLLNALQQEMGTSVLFITHDLGVVAQVADEVAVMRKGEIVERGDVRSVIMRPSHDYTKQLIASIPRMEDDDETAA
jgi:ABC-type dipeptide/oligopeptide/nickel transport system ATPase component